MERMGETAKASGLIVHTRNFKMRLEGPTSGKTGNLAVAIEVFEVVPSLYMVDVRKAFGDTLEYHKFYKSFCAYLTDIIWITPAEAENKQTMPLLGQ
ncbi:hypothetical protein R1flu_012696 [Riccia fluitans]|uniref:Uncharacterized protein n=1 Tax=Riccia fluitans TaxID=41844 RepID=A0ABD1ZDU6_9MARC